MFSKALIRLSVVGSVLGVGSIYKVTEVFMSVECHRVGIGNDLMFGYH